MRVKRTSKGSSSTGKGSRRGVEDTTQSGPWRAYARVARFEYLPAELLLIMIPVLLVTKGPGDVLNLAFAEGVVVFFLLYFTGFMANALADRKVDASYRSYKSSIADAVDQLGEGGLKVIMTLHVLVALLLAIHLTMMIGNPVILGLVTLGLFLGIGYSMRPFNFKTRGVVHGLALATSAFLLPLTFLLIVMAGRIDFIMILFVLGFTLAMYSLEFGNQAMDHYEDKARDLTTPSVRYSMQGSLRFALILLPIGLLLTLISLSNLSMMKFREIHPALSGWWVLALVGGLLLAGFYRPATALNRIYKATKTPRDDRRRRGRILRALEEVDHPAWQASGALGVVLICGIIFGSMFFTFSVPKPEEPVVNDAPEVMILNNPDMIVNVGDEVHLEAEVWDDGEIVSMGWDFGDGTGIGGEKAVDHRYNEIGSYRITLTVIDAQGAKGWHWINITVTDLYFSKLDFRAEKHLTYTHVDFSYNVTNDKDLKKANELIVKIYYQEFLLQSNGLGHVLKPARIWNRTGGLDIAIDKDPVFTVVLIHEKDDEVVVVQERIIRAEDQ